MPVDQREKPAYLQRLLDMPEGARMEIGAAVRQMREGYETLQRLLMDPARKQHRDVEVFIRDTSVASDAIRILMDYTEGFTLGHTDSYLQTTSTTGGVLEFFEAVGISREELKIGRYYFGF
ncbi:MAG: hypothetical protein HYU56_02805 [Candidatus Aenigmarchaeota archaeon]|nr:hypothetical protein [Candidatus Aenigmarchaeota archaeon]